MGPPERPLQRPLTLNSPPVEIEAHRAMEEALHRLYEQHTDQPWREPKSPGKDEDK